MHVYSFVLLNVELKQFKVFLYQTISIAYNVMDFLSWVAEVVLFYQISIARDFSSFNVGLDVLNKRPH
jgi:hypothetical protein